MTELPRWARDSRAQWRHTGRERPPFAEEPGPGQESVWDYPRPPRVEPDGREVVVRSGERLIARSREALRVLETASPPTFYVPRRDVDEAWLVPASGSSRCEWKGEATYWSVRTPEGLAERVAWSYEDPFEDFAALRGYLSFYPAHLECRVDGERVRPQPGGFYGGWVTSEVVGPFKGADGSAAWW